MESFKLESLKLESLAVVGKSQAKLKRTERSWKEPIGVGKNRAKLEIFFWVGKFRWSWKVSVQLESSDCSWKVWMGCYELIFRFWTFSQLMICEMSIFKSKRLWPEWSQRKIRSKTHFLIFWSWNILSLSTLAAFISWLSGQNWYRLGFCWSSDVKLSSRWYFRSILHSVESEPNGWTELVIRI